MKQFFLLFSHSLTEEQKKDAETFFSVDKFITLSPDLQKIFSNVPPDLETLGEYLSPIKEWLRENAQKQDIVLIQGDFGATYHLVRFCKVRDLRAVYATTERQSVDEIQPDGSVVTQRIFKHKRFRQY